MDIRYEYSVTEGGTLLRWPSDEEGDPTDVPMAFDPETGEWIEPRMTFGEAGDSRPIEKAEAEAIMARQRATKAKLDYRQSKI